MIKLELVLALMALSLRLTRSFHDVKFISKIQGSIRLHSFVTDAQDEPFFITSTANSKVKLLKSLHMKKKRDQLGLVPVEGFHQIYESIESDVRPDFILLSKRVENSALCCRLQNLIKNKNLMSIVSYIEDDIYQTISDTENGQGYIGVFHKPQWNHCRDESSSNRRNGRLLDITTSISRHKDKIANTLPLIVLLDRIADPGNMGTLIRSCYGLGVHTIIAAESCDVFSPKVLRSSMGLSLQQPIIEVTWKEVHKLLLSLQNEYDAYTNKINSTNQKKTIQIIIADGSASNAHYHEINYTSHSTVVVVGSESKGVSEKEIDELLLSKDSEGVEYIKRKVQIPMVRSLESFNAAVAGSIILAEASKQRMVF